jgi:signal transduction histidine kinase
LRRIGAERSCHERGLIDGSQERTPNIRAVEWREQAIRSQKAKITSGANSLQPDAAITSQRRDHIIENFSAVAAHGLPDEWSATVKRGLPISDSDLVHELIAAGERRIHYDDIAALPTQSEGGRHFNNLTGTRSYLAVALRRGAETVKAMSASPGDPQPVFDLIVRRAPELCNAVGATLLEYDGTLVHFRASHRLGVSSRAAEEALTAYSGLYPMAPSRAMNSHRAILDRQICHIRDVEAAPDLVINLSRSRHTRSEVHVPLLRDDACIGVLMLISRHVGGFSDSQLELLQTFAEQAVIAIGAAAAFRALQQRTAELADRNKAFAEQVEHQAATIDVLKVMSSSTSDTQPVFDMILSRAIALSGASSGGIFGLVGGLLHPWAVLGFDTPARAALIALFPRAPSDAGVMGHAILQRRTLYARDYHAENPDLRQRARPLGYNALVAVPLLRDGEPIGVLTVQHERAGAFSPEHIALLETFAEQAVIAIGSVATFRELQERTAELAQRQEELHITFENMNDGVALFDEHHRIVAWNANFLHILDLPEGALAQGRPFIDYVRMLAERGEYGEGADVEEQVQRVLGLIGQRRSFERARPGGRTVEVRNNPVADGGFVLIYADITERKRAEAEIAAARDAAEQATRTIEAAYRDLKVAQANLVQAEKMASLGQLTAGIAHEIKNPLHFVNNFSALSTELIDELREVLAPQPLIGAVRAEVDELTSMLRGNLEKVVQHGRRADGIVKSMLEHSRGASTERRAVDFNALVEEALNLAYHGARAQDQSFNIALERAYADDLAPIELNPQDITRVLLNLIGNGFHAARQRAVATKGHEPTLGVTTRALGGAVEIRVRDNGTGISADIRDRIFEPFFTTKPTGEGTGLGLSITYDIVTKQHGGTIEVDSEPGAFTEFTVTLPRNSAGAPA